MKCSEMNERQRKAYKNIEACANYELGGLENDLLDYCEDEEEYKRSFNLLHDHKELVKFIYMCATSQWYHGGGWVSFGANAKAYIRDVNFCGTDFLMEQCDAIVTKEGY